jgi:hypothetical protein
MKTALIIFSIIAAVGIATMGLVSAATEVNAKASVSRGPGTTCRPTGECFPVTCTDVTPDPHSPRQQNLNCHG